jgi:1-acyl-sn-glycerol-3-phosphate acyltransferase
MLDTITRPARTTALPAPRSLAGDLLDTVRAKAQAAVLRPLFALVGTLEVSGREHLERLAGPVVFAANHRSHLDTLAVLAALPAERRKSLRVAAAEDYFYSSRARGLLVGAALSTFPFRRHGDPRRSLRLAEALLASGRSLLVFPEGTRAAAPLPGRFLPGISLIAARGRAPVVPVYIAGTADVLPKGARLPRRHPVEVRFGAPITRSPDARHDAFADVVRAHVSELAWDRRSA